MNIQPQFICSKIYTRLILENVASQNRVRDFQLPVKDEAESVGPTWNLLILERFARFLNL